MAMIMFTAMIVKAKTIIMAMTIKPYESIAYTEIASALPAPCFLLTIQLNWNLQ